MSHTLALTVLLALTVGQKPADPPYRKFKGLSFEPSAVVFITQDQRDFLYVLNDKDPLIYSFKLESNDTKEVTGLANDAGKPIGVIALGNGCNGTFIPQKFEALAPWPEGGFIAATAFDRSDMAYNQIVRFTVDPGTKSVPSSVGDVEALVTTGVRPALEGLPPATHGNIKRTSFKIEGISAYSDGDGTKLLVGVRRYYYFDDKDKVDRDINEVILIARFGVGNKGALTYEGAVDFSMNEDGPCPAMGLSDLQKDSDGSYLILASREDPPGISTIEGHAGALYRVSKNELEGNLDASAPPVKGTLGKPLRTFVAKPEGITILPGKGRYLVVFDDDSDGWKGLFQNYALHEALYEIVTLAHGPSSVSSK